MSRDPVLYSCSCRPAPYRVDGCSACVLIYLLFVVSLPDALLADLQNTTAHISSYQAQAGQTAPHQHNPQHQHQQQQYFQPQRQQQQPYVGHNNSNIGGGGNYNNSSYQQQQQPPYPNRYKNGLDGAPNIYHHQQQQQTLPSHGYQQQHSTEQPQGEGHIYRQAGQGVVTVKRVSYASSEDGGGHSGSSTPPPLPPPPPSEVLDSLALAGGLDNTTDGVSHAALYIVFLGRHPQPSHNFKS